jgi:multidrug resistance efflux pump
MFSASITNLYYVYLRTDDAYVRANVVGVAPHVSVLITELSVQDNQHVKQDQLLFVVDATPYRSAVDKAEADLALTNLQIGALGDSIRAARARAKHNFRPTPRTTSSISTAFSRC